MQCPIILSSNSLYSVIIDIRRSGIIVYFRSYAFIWYVYVWLLSGLFLLHFFCFGYLWEICLIRSALGLGIIILFYMCDFYFHIFWYWNPSISISLPPINYNIYSYFSLIVTSYFSDSYSDSENIIENCWCELSISDIYIEISHKWSARQLPVNIYLYTNVKSNSYYFCILYIFLISPYILWLIFTVNVILLVVILWDKYLLIFYLSLYSHSGYS